MSTATWGSVAFSRSLRGCSLQEAGDVKALLAEYLLSSSQSWVIW